MRTLPKKGDSVDWQESVREIKRFCQWVAEKERDARALTKVQEHEYRLLTVVGTEGAITVGEVAEKMDQDPGHVGRTLEALRHKGWVSLQRGARDGRQKTVQVVEDGRRVLEECMRNKEYLITRVFESSAKENQEAVLSLFQQITRLIEREPKNLVDDFAEMERETGRRPKARARRPVFRKKGRGRLGLGGSAEWEFGGWDSAGNGRAGKDNI